jgi:hypothetical protein
MWSATDPAQAQVIKVAIPTPFLAAPPGSNGGSVAKNDGSEITDEELQKLKDAKLLYGGVEVEWSRMNGECCGVQLGCGCDYGSVCLWGADHSQRMSSARSGLPAPTSRAVTLPRSSRRRRPRNPRTVMARGTGTGVAEVVVVDEAEEVDEAGVGTGEESTTEEDGTGRMQVAREEACRPWCRPVRGNRRGGAAARRTRARESAMCRAKGDTEIRRVDNRRDNARR